MDMFKKLFLLLLALTMVFCLAACNGEEPEDTEPTLNPGDPDCEHVWADWEVVKEASCAKDGSQKRECEECGKEEKEELLAYGHTYRSGECTECEKKQKDCEHSETYELMLKEASCTEDGEEREVCKKCKAVVRKMSIGAYWHSNRKTVVVKESTCTEAGMEQEICQICDEVVDEYYTWVKGHEYEYVYYQDPTCTEAGWYSYYYCLVCDYKDGYEEIPAAGHDYQFGSCYDCGAEDANCEVITAPGINYVTYNIQQASKQTYVGVDAVIQVETGEIASKNDVVSYEFTASISGRYFIWFNDIYSGYRLKLYVYNSKNERVAYSDYIYNNEGYYVDLDAGSYTIKVS